MRSRFSSAHVEASASESPGSSSSAIAAFAAGVRCPSTGVKDPAQPPGPPEWAAKSRRSTWRAGRPQRMVRRTSILLFLLGPGVLKDLAVLGDRDFHFLLVSRLKDDLESPVDLRLVLDLGDLHNF